jgi:hypothetical protein
LKFESKNPGSSKDDLPEEVVTWVLEFKAAKLGAPLVQKIQQTISRCEVENYLSTESDPDSVVLVECPTCDSRMDITPYSDNENVFCNRCSKFLSPELNQDDINFGICQGCAYYTKLKSNRAAQGKAGDSFCYRCAAKQTMMGFLFSVGVALLVGLVNIITIFFFNRFFPILLIFCGVSLLWALFKLIDLIMVSLTRTATGTTPMERATAAVRKGNTDEALKIVNDLPDATSNPGILLNMTRGLLNARDYKRAKEFADLLVEQFPNFQLGFATRLEALAHLGASQEELADAHRSLQEVNSRNSLMNTHQLQLMSTK